MYMMYIKIFQVNMQLINLHHKINNLVNKSHNLIK